MTTMFPILEENARKAERAHMGQAADEQRRRRRMAAHRKADTAMVLRILMTCVVGLSLYAAMNLHWVSQGFAEFCFTLWTVYLVFYMGIWYQRRWARGGGRHGS